MPSNVNESVLKKFDALIEQKETNIDQLVMAKIFEKFILKKNEVITE